MKDSLYDIETGAPTLEGEPLNIFVLRTNIHTKQDQEKIGLLMNQEPRIRKWTVDIEDVDKVLRIESYNLSLEEIQQLASLSGYSCEELLD